MVCCFGAQFTVPQTHSFIIWPNNSTLVVYPRETGKHVHPEPCTQMFISVLSITAKKEIAHMSINWYAAK